MRTKPQGKTVGRPRRGNGVPRRTLARSAADYLPDRRSLPALRRAAASCRGCDLFRRATQVVFGAGPACAALMVVGEVPGDVEDRTGAPFVGPAGRLLDEALVAAGIDRGSVYVTNAVKHFSWEPRGKRRLHSKPKLREIAACRPWLEAEIRVVRPRTIVCLGATAAQSLLGRGFRISRRRGESVKSDWAPVVISTWHPSALLRAPTEPERERMRRDFFEDIQRAARTLSEDGCGSQQDREPCGPSSRKLPNGRIHRNLSQENQSCPKL